MNDLEAIGQRYSRRSYLDIPIEINKLRNIEKIIDDINDESDLNIELIEDASFAFNSFIQGCSVFKGVRTIVLIKGDKFDESLREKAGYYGERLVLELIKLGLGTCFINSNYNKKCIELDIQNDEEMVCILTVGYVSSSRSLMENIMYKALHEQPKSVSNFVCSDCEIPQWVQDGIRAVQIAPPTINSHKVRFEYINEELLIYIDNDSIQNMIELGIAKLHFEIATGGKFEIGNYAKFDLVRSRAID